MTISTKTCRRKSVIGLLLIMLLAVGVAAMPLITEPVTTDFAAYHPPVVTITAAPGANDFSVATDFSNVTNWNNSLFSDKELALLRQNGFVVSPAPDYDYAHFHELYARVKYNNDLSFITTDAMLHSFHVLYDYALRQMETDHFAGDLKAMDQQLLQAQDILSSQKILYSNDALARQAL